MTVPPPPHPSNCLQCAFFFVTWDPRFPRGCTVFNIKSRELPSFEVFRATGKHCPAFQKSERVKG